MSQNAKQVKPKFKVGQKLILKNKWALAQCKDGLPAKILRQRTLTDGQIVYDILAQRPPLEMATLETDLEIISE